LYHSVCRGALFAILLVAVFTAAFVAGVVLTRHYNSKPVTLVSSSKDDNLTIQSTKCFETSEELQQAVLNKFVLLDDVANAHLSEIYGLPVGTWCVSRVTTFRASSTHTVA
jgi:hypothetical protein